MEKKYFDIIIIGAGPGGLAVAAHLSRFDIRIALLEKKSLPNHKVCGEYVSKEILPYLSFLGIDPYKAGAKNIEYFELTEPNGKYIRVQLPLGGIGISRYHFDYLFYEKIKDKVDFFVDSAETVSFQNNSFEVRTRSGKILKAPFVVGAFGKRSNLDKVLNRKFIQKKSPWLAVKNHFEYDFPDHLVSIHNFKGGYCGLSKTETNKVNACYLTSFKSFKRYGNISEFENKILIRNPFLKDFFENAVPVFKKPLAISQISFERKKPVENHIFMIGDSAGLIHPLCGNGMAMAVRSAEIFSGIFLQAFQSGDYNRIQMENRYEFLWKKEFHRRLRTGRLAQVLLLNPAASAIGFSLIQKRPKLLRTLISQTHGSL